MCHFFMKKTGQRNTNTRFAASIVFTFFLCMFTASWVATQYLAGALRYQTGLGEAAWTFRAWKIYQPFAWWFWNLQWMNETGPLQSYILHMQFIVCIGALLSVIVGIYMFYRRSMHSELPTELHGSARWATVKDVEKMKLLSHTYKKGKKTVQYKAAGIFVGALDTKEGRKVLRYNEPAHALCFAPSRSGKGVGPVLTTLLSYPNSTMTNDIKGENFELSSGFRHSAGSLVIRFDPTSLDQKSIDGKARYNVASSWNVLDEIRAYTDYDEMDAQNIAAAIADPKGEGMDDHWVSTSFDLLTGVILHVLYFERDKTLAGVATYLSDPSFTDPEQMFNRMLDAEHDPNGVMGWVDSNGQPTKTHPAVAREARAMLNKEEKERNSVLSTAKTKLTLYAEPIVARNTSRSDFKITDLMNHTKPVSLYMVVPPSDKDRLSPLIRLFLTFTLRRLTKDMDFEEGRSVKGYKHRLLLLVDELASLKKLEQLQDGLGYIAGYGITAFLFVQDTIQLKEAYGDNETITAGCQLRLAFAPNTLQTAEDLSKMTGVSTVSRQNVSYSGSRISSMLNQMSVSEELVERPLMTADEMMKMPRDEAIIFNTGHPPIKCKKLEYFRMPEFVGRAKMASPSRVAMTYREPNGKIGGSWFMVGIERNPGDDKSLSAIINCYDDFPEMRVVVKQQSLETEDVLEFEYALFDEAGMKVERTLTVDDLEFTLKPVGDASKFLPAEAFEVHFLVKDMTLYKEFSQKGFYRDIAVAERNTRKMLKDQYRDKGIEKDGNAIETTIEKIADRGRYSGKVVHDVNGYVVLENSSEIISMHRKLALNVVPKVGETVTISYSGRKGRVL